MGVFVKKGIERKFIRSNKKHNKTAFIGYFNKTATMTCSIPIYLKALRKHAK